MQYSLVGWPEDEPTLDLDWRVFSYAGKFVTPHAGKAVAREDDAVVGAVAFDEDRTDPATLVVRYVTVRDDRQGAGVGPRLLAFVRDRARKRGYERVRIAVNNPVAYEASYRAGFGYTGESTGVAELVLAWPSDAGPDAYREGLERFRERDLSREGEAFVERQRETGPPPVVDAGQ